MDFQALQGSGHSAEMIVVFVRTYDIINRIKLLRFSQVSVDLFTGLSRPGIHEQVFSIALDEDGIALADVNEVNLQFS